MLHQTNASVKYCSWFGSVSLEEQISPSPSLLALWPSTILPNMIISSAAAVATAAPPPSHPPSCVISLKPCRFLKRRKLKRIGNQGSRRGKNLCRAELVHDAPFAAAIGSCVLTSLVAPIHSTDSEDEDEGGAIDSTDARFAVMGIIGFIPYFNWLSWVFAWLDTSRSRYLVYSIVYLAPYLRTNLSISLDESWLPITSILVCIIHIQLEASIRNGDLEGFAFFKKAAKLVSPFIEKDDSVNSHDKSSGGRRMKHEEPGNRFPTKQIDGLHQNEGIEETREKKSD